MENIGDIKKIFTDIFLKNEWGGAESVSGPGSNLEQTKVLINKLPLLFKQYNIQSILDIPCGDFYWMSNVDLTGIDYTGADIVDRIIYDNQNNYPKYSFINLNLVSSRLPKTDLIFCRDCLVHLPYDDIYKAINNIKNSGSKYLLTTSFTDHDNIDMFIGGWRPINLCKEPFNLPKPIYIINEGCTEDDGNYKDKSMHLWQIKDI
jgi:hypothetical protein